MSELFDNITPGAQVVQPKAKAKPKSRIEYYDNGPDCKAPRTQYGLLWDIGHSTERCNLNFGLLDIDWVADHLDSAQLTTLDHRHLTAVAERYVELGSKEHLVTFGKWNSMAGTGTYNFKAGIKDMYFGTAAIMQLGYGQAPKVWLYHNGEWFDLDTGWKPAVYSSNPAKLWQVSL